MIPFLPRLLELILLWGAFVWLVLCVSLLLLLGLVMVWEQLRPRRRVVVLRRIW